MQAALAERAALLSRQKVPLDVFIILKVIFS